jgi:hypothetical protein
MDKVSLLRKKYPSFVYKSYKYKLTKKGLEIFFNFEIKPSLKFNPKVIIRDVKKENIDKVKKSQFDNLIFHLGLIEIPSYWKLTCSPLINIECGFINTEQKKWWKDLVLKGLGQFFFENKIDFTVSNFLTMESTKESKSSFREIKSDIYLENNFLIPIGGGRDSIVTLEAFKKKKDNKIGVFLINPSKAALDVIKTARQDNKILIERKIDPLLLSLNRKGFLNGHTPFTALLSFYSVVSALLFGYKNVVFSNEKSSNEGNLKYKGLIINHQWSKSYEFEKKFKKYCKKFISSKINYFSFLRKFTEIEISKMFIRYPKYFFVFSSCNVSQKVGKRWCGNCPKCLFVYATLYPFLDNKILLKIFGRDIFENKNLLHFLEGLLGKGKPKPFECVGTIKENRLIFNLCLQKVKKIGKIPYLLTKIE